MSARGPIVDLACGSGRNGLFLARLGLPVVFADHSQEASESVAGELHAHGLPDETWHVDLEAGTGNPLAGRRFAAALVFRYLHRPLMPYLIASILPGGLVVYETFTLRNPEYGRPATRTSCSARRARHALRGLDHAPLLRGLPPGP
ncbi:MAG: hypothetical protein IPL19_34130 [Sandaracinaceae bacterium]|nr:hypothetical protein [Sandaracinaceae bacterium]